MASPIVLLAVLLALGIVALLFIFQMLRLLACALTALALLVLIG